MLDSRSFKYNDIVKKVEPMRKKQKKDEQPYKVGKPFVKWLEGQIKRMKQPWAWACENRWDKVERELTKEAYEFIRSVVKE